MDKKSFVLRVLFAVLLIRSFVEGVSAVPEIDNWQGNFSDGFNVTISGSDFGNHEDNALTEDYIIAAWDNLEDGTIDTDVFRLGGGRGPERVQGGTNQKQNSNYCARAARYTGEQQWITLTGNIVSGTGKYGISHSPTIDPYPEKLFVSGWFMFPENFTSDLVDNGVGSQFKFLSGVSVNDHAGNTYWGVHSGSQYANARLNFEDGRIAENPLILGPNQEVDQSVWYRFDIAIDTSKPLNEKVSYFYINGKQVCNNYHYTEPPKCGANQSECPRHWEPMWNRYARAYNGDTPYQYHDDFYTDYTWARIELCNESVWNESKRKHCELQIPLDWFENEITFDFNQGSFNEGEKAYLFIVDENGSVNKQGYPITLGKNSNSESFDKPVINNVKGNFSYNEEVVISGSGFGVKENSSLILFENFEDNVTEGSRLDSQGVWWQGPDDITYETSNQRTLNSDLNLISIMTGEDGTGVFHKEVFSEPGKKFISFWTYIDFVNLDARDRWQLKLFRAIAGPNHGDYPSFSFQTWWNTDGSLDNAYLERAGIEGGTIWGSTAKDGQWLRYDLTYEDSSGVDVSDGSVKFRVYCSDGTTNEIGATDFATRTSENSGLISHARFGYYLTNNLNVPHEVHTYWDDIYIDNSWQRIELCDKSNFSQSTHCEIQILKNWSSDSININFNQGSFQGGETVYLFIIDEQGNVSEGYPITILYSVENYHPADIDNDRVVSFTEIQDYLDRWLNGEITINELLDGVNEWRGL